MAVIKERQDDILVAIVLTRKGVSSIRIGADTDESTERCYKFLANLTPQIRSLGAAAKLLNL